MPPLQKAGLAPSYFRLVLPYIKGLRGELAVHNKNSNLQICATGSLGMFVVATPWEAELSYSPILIPDILLPKLTKLIQWD